MNTKKYLTDLFKRTLEVCAPDKAVTNALTIEENTISVDNTSIDITNRPVYVLAVGKAAMPMFQGLHNLLKDRIADSLVITSDHRYAASCKANNIMKGSHPVPDRKSLEAGEKAVSFFEMIPQDALVITLISGGTSSLMCLPSGSISIEDLNATFELLNNSGARIHEINTVRKHCSLIKGGQLLRHLKPSVSLVDLMISDVPNNDLSVIGSGPTIGDHSTFQDAYHILLEYKLWDRIPESVHLHIEKGLSGEDRETSGTHQIELKEHYSKIISSAQQFAETAAKLADGDGYSSWIAEESYNMDVKKVASMIENRIQLCIKDTDDTDDQQSKLLIFYGESTVEVTGEGKGGRNQELALRGALKIDGLNNVAWLSAGTDGIDGPTDAAGAVVDSQTIYQTKEQGIDFNEFLLNNDSYHFHEAMGTLLKTGPTGNNLADVVMVLVA